MQSNVFSTKKTLNLRGRILDLSTPKVMGILNVTPDSFYDGNRHITVSTALHQTEKMVSEGVDIIDIGGYSSRPGADDISEAEELSRVVPIIEGIRKEFSELIISIDTFRTPVARAAIESGASMINDISAGELDPSMFDLVAAVQVPYVAMHMRGTPQTMIKHTIYTNLVKEVIDHLHTKISKLHQLGVKDVVVDPGFGFAKTAAQNFELLRQLDALKILGQPVLVGLSRKSMIWRTLGITPDEALNGTTTLNTIALLKGASILRVHDVKEAVEAVKLVNFVM